MFNVILRKLIFILCDIFHFKTNKYFRSILIQLISRILVSLSMDEDYYSPLFMFLGYPVPTINYILSNILLREIIYSNCLWHLTIPCSCILNSKRKLWTIVGMMDISNLHFDWLVSIRASENWRIGNIGDFNFLNILTLFTCELQNLYEF